MKTEEEKHAGGHMPPPAKHKGTSVFSWAQNKLNGVDLYG